MNAEQRRGIGLGGAALIGLGAVLWLEQQSKPPATPPPASGSAWPRIQAGSLSLQRPDWVRDHGCNAPVYDGVSGALRGWLACGTILQTTGPVKGIPQLVINSDGSAGGVLGNVPCYPVGGGGWLSVADVDLLK